MYLKRRVHRYTRACFALFTVFLLWTAFGTSSSAPYLFELPLPPWLQTIAVPVLTLVLVMALGAIPGDHGKAVLVFLRVRNPLPGCRAFEKASMMRDPRIHVEDLRTALGGSFPRAAIEQNATWYRLYKSIAAEPDIEGVHFEYLLFRDLTWLTILFLSTSAFSFVLVGPSHVPFFLLSLFFLALAALFRHAAAERGVRFVNSVLARTAAAHGAGNKPASQG